MNAVSGTTPILMSLRLGKLTNKILSDNEKLRILDTEPSRPFPKDIIQNSRFFFKSYYVSSPKCGPCYCFWLRNSKY
nr:unnamed protein product [Callosobruchus chinensis]